MASSRYIAALVGPGLVAVAASEVVNARVWDAVNAPAVYQSGLLLFVAGLSIVRAHNRWSAGWPVLITLVGWFGLVAGLARMFLTGAAQQNTPTIALPLEFALLAIGAFLSFKAFWPSRAPA